MADSEVKRDAFDAWSMAELDAVESALDAWVRADAPSGLGDAMRYAVLDGGKRLRPLLVLAAAEAVRGNRQAALRAACAVELIHAYSLVHDDLPVHGQRRPAPGQAHRARAGFGVAQAMLAGDAMQALAFEVLTPDPAGSKAQVCRRRCRRGCARFAGARVTGDALAWQAGKRSIWPAWAMPADEQAALRDMHRRKTERPAASASVQMRARPAAGSAA